MRINRERIRYYLYDIKKNALDLEDLLKKYTDDSILQDPIIIKAIKFSLIEIAEAMANTLQHILAKGMGRPVSGYIDTLHSASANEIISEGLFSAMKPFNFGMPLSTAIGQWTID